MIIHLMTDSECREALQRAAIGRLACANEMQPYVVPIYFVLDEDHLYSFANLGQKIEWMRANPRVCLEVDERIAHDQWQSVVVFGQYEELTEVPRYAAARMRAHELLQHHAMWWEPACVACEHDNRPYCVTPVFYRINIVRMTGHRAMPNETDDLHPEGKQHESWWDQIIRHLGVER